MISSKVSHILKSLSKIDNEFFLEKLTQSLRQSIEADAVIIANHSIEANTLEALAYCVNDSQYSGANLPVTDSPFKDLISSRNFCYLNNLQKNDQNAIEIGSLDIAEVVGIPVNPTDEESSWYLIALFSIPVADIPEVEEVFESLTGVISRELNNCNLMKRLQLTNQVINNSRDAIIITNENVEIIYVNQAFERITGYKESEVIGENPRMLSAKKHNLEYYKNMWHEILHIGYWSGEVVNRRKNGQNYPERLTINKIVNDSGSIVNYVAFISDLTDDKYKDLQLFNKTHYDSVTGLPNRTFINEELNSYVNTAEADKEGFYLFMLGLDRFKDVNEYYGYSIGDRLLRKFSNRVKSLLRLSDTFGRIGGDEFVLLIHGEHPLSDIQRLAEKICAAFEEPLKIGELKVKSSVSIGVANYPRDAHSVDTLLKRSEHALYTSKEKGRATYSLFKESMQLDALRRIKLRNSLEKAIKQRSLSLNYQPIINCADKAVTKFEVLVRWNNDGENISPNEFIPIAEEFGMINRLGSWVLDSACKMLSQIHAAGYQNVTFNINRSVEEFDKEGKRAEQWLATLVNNNICASNITFEMTETVLAKEHQGYLDNLKKLKDAGCKISMDDFGTGFSSLSYLRRFPIDELKIDRSFIAEIVENDSDQVLVKTILAMGKSLEIEVVAEGAETGQQVELLRDYGCDFIQGYFYSKPLPQDSILDFLTAHGSQPSLKE